MSSNHDIDKSSISTLTIRLLRRPLSLPNDPPGGPYNFLVWGYFDWLIPISKHCQSLRDMYFNSKKKNDIDEKPAPYYYEEQILCIYTHHQKHDIFTSELPVIVITEIKVNDQLINDFNDFEKIKNAIDSRLHIDLQKVEYHIFNSLGYSDLVLISRSSDYETIIKALTRLRNTCYEGHPLVTSTYSIYGIHKDLIERWDEKRLKHALIFMSLNTRTSVKKLTNKLINMLNPQQDETSACLEADNRKYMVDTYPLFGKYDSGIYIYKNTDKSDDQLSQENGSCGKDIAKLFLHQQKQQQAILSADHASFKNHINYTRTHWYIDLDIEEDYSQNQSDETKAPVTGKDAQNDIDGRRKHFYKLWNVSQFIVEKSGKQRDGSKKKNGNNEQYPEYSLALALQDILKFYWQIENNETANRLLCEEFAKLLQRLLENLLCSIGIPTDCINDYFSKQEINIDDFEKYDTHPMQDIGSFELSIHLFSEMLQNWVQATRMVMETPIYNFKFINSSSKLYISYFGVVEIIEKAIIDTYEKNHTNSHNNQFHILNFFTTIHHADTIKSHLLFPEIMPVYRFVPIRLDKDSFFSPLKSIPYIAHEIGHYINPESRLRNECFLETICYDLARRIFYGILLEQRNTYFYSKIQHHWNYQEIETIEKMSVVIQNAIEKSINEYSHVISMEEQSLTIFSRRLNIILEFTFGFSRGGVIEQSNRLIEEVNNFFSSNPSYKENRQTVEELVNWMSNVIDKGGELDNALNFWYIELEKIGSPTSLRNSCAELIRRYQARKIIVLDVAKDICKELLYGVTCQEGGLSLLEKLQEPAETPQEKKLIVDYLFDKRLNEDTTYNHNIIQNRIFDHIVRENYRDLINLYFDSFVETNADLFMIRILQLPLQKYKKVFDYRQRKKEESKADTYGRNQDIDLPHESEYDLDQLEQFRRDIITAYFYPKSKKDYSKTSQGMYDTALVKYLKQFDKTFLTNLISDERIINLITNYHHNSMQKPQDENITAEIEFIETYWEKGLRISNGHT